MQTTCARQTHRVRGIQHGSVGCQRVSRRRASHRRKVLFGRNAGPAPEQPIEVKLRQARVRSHVLEARLLAEALVDETDGFRNTREIAAVYKAVMRRFHETNHSHTPSGRDPILAVAHGWRRLGGTFEGYR